MTLLIPRPGPDHSLPGIPHFGGLSGFGSSVHASRHFAAMAAAGLEHVPAVLPETVDLTKILPPLDDQGQVGRCGPFAAAHLRESLSLRRGHQLQALAPDALYTMYRDTFEPQLLDQDTGVVNAQLFSLIPNTGIPLAADCPPLSPTLATAPVPGPALARAHWYGNVRTYQLQGYADFEACLAAGLPFVLGFEVFENIYDAAGSGRVPMPQGGIAGGHDVLCCGYLPDPTVTRWWKCRNQWQGFTQDGDLYLPDAYVRNAGWVSDCWTMWLSDEAPVNP